MLELKLDTMSLEGAVFAGVVPAWLSAMALLQITQVKFAYFFSDWTFDRFDINSVKGKNEVGAFV